jgi:hypothetical protein
MSHNKSEQFEKVEVLAMKAQDSLWDAREYYRQLSIAVTALPEKAKEAYSMVDEEEPYEELIVSAMRGYDPKQAFSGYLCDGQTAETSSDDIDEMYEAAIEAEVIAVVREYDESDSEQLESATIYAKEIEEHLDEVRFFYRWLKETVKEFNEEEKQLFASDENLNEWYKEAIAAAIRNDALIDVVEEYLDRAEPTETTNQQ